MSIPIHHLKKLVVTPEEVEKNSPIMEIEGTTRPIENNPPSQKLVATPEEVEKNSPISTTTFPKYYVRRNKI